MDKTHDYLSQSQHHDQPLPLLLAKGVEPISSQHLDKTEDIEFQLLPKAKVFEMLKNGDFMQALMIAPLWKYFSEHL